ncbi:MAG: hypothetical protein IKY53_00315, partial [Lachnospiraceae bacterium]|nr:hypothetical protein [Lachnospiraceae bacterium]
LEMRSSLASLEDIYLEILQGCADDDTESLQDMQEDFEETANEQVDSATVIETSDEKEEE